MANFAAAKEELADLLGRGFDPMRHYRRHYVEWWWYGGIVQIETTVRKGDPAVLFVRKLLSRFSTGSRECRVRIDLDYAKNKRRPSRAPGTNHHTVGMLESAYEVAHRYNEVIERLGGPDAPSEDELVQLMNELNASSRDMGSSKALEMHPFTIDQSVRVTHLQSLVPPERRAKYPRFTSAPTRDRLDEAWHRLGPA